VDDRIRRPSIEDAGPRTARASTRIPVYSDITLQQTATNRQ
jgi:hypothetical protein